MERARLLYVTGHAAGQYADEIAANKKLIAAEKLAALEAENAAIRILIDRANLNSRPEPVVLSTQEKRNRSRAGLDRPPEPLTWRETMPKPLDPHAAPQPRKRLEDMSAAERKIILEIM